MIYQFNFSELLIFGLTLLILDFLWINYYIKNVYKKWFANNNIKMVLNYKSIILVYLIMILIYPIFIKNNNTKKEILNGFLIGFFIYSIYALTISSLFKNYTLNMVVSEILWGTMLYGLATISVNLFKKII